jgi:hypothetical protein
VGLRTIFELKSREYNLKQVEHVQAVVKDPLGVGKSTVFNFYAPINLATNVIDYPQTDDDLTLLTQQKYTEYMHKQLLKVCYYL